MKINLGTKETWMKVGEQSWRLVKTIGKKGVQAMVVETAGKATMAALEGDMTKVKQSMTFDEIVGPKKVKSDKPKKKLFGKKKAAEELIEEIKVSDEPTVEVIKPENVEIVDKK